MFYLQGSLNTYRFCDNVWTFVLNDVEFREVTDLVKVDKVKIVACDGKSKLTLHKYFYKNIYVSSLDYLLLYKLNSQCVTLQVA